MAEFQYLHESEIYPLPIKDGYLVYAPLSSVVMSLSADEVSRLENYLSVLLMTVKLLNCLRILQMREAIIEQFFPNILPNRFINSLYCQHINVILIVDIAILQRGGKINHCRWRQPKQ